MKTLYLSLFFIFVTISGFAQDTLFTKEGITINCKVLEVSSSQVKYKSKTIPEKQFLVIATTDIASIHYLNGTYDVFETLADSSSFRTTVIDGKSIPNQPAEKKFDNKTNADEYAQKVARQEAVADAVFVGIRVVGFILRVALEIATAGSCHSGGHDYHGNHGTNHPRGH